MLFTISFHRRHTTQCKECRTPYKVTQKEDGSDIMRPRFYCCAGFTDVGSSKRALKSSSQLLTTIALSHSRWVAYWLRRGMLLSPSSKRDQSEPSSEDRLLSRDSDRLGRMVLASRCTNESPLVGSCTGAGFPLPPVEVSML
jgi:hypothetical protein